jgi:anti-anti-sigma factor
MVTFAKSLNLEEWHEFNNALTDMAKKGYNTWIMNLRDLALMTSVDIGMWVTSNAKITNQGGSMKFIVRKNSVVQRTLNVTKLNGVLSIEYV